MREDCGYTGEGNMSDKGLVSIIVPVYNVASYLPEALDSVIRQSYKNLEIIIIDDGSTDKSGEICDKYAESDPRIRLIHQENRGLSAARNRGLDMMKGDYVAFFDSDDVYDVRFVETLVNAMQPIKQDLIDDASSRIDMAVCRFAITDDDGGMEHAKIKPPISAGRYDRVKALRALPDGMINQSVWNKLYRKELFGRVRFPEGDVYEDLATTFRIIDKCENVCVVDEVLYFHRKRKGSIIDTFTKRNICDWRKSYAKYQTFIMKNMNTVFGKEQLRRSYETRIDQLIEFYVRYSCAGQCEDKRFARYQRDYIVKLGKKTGIKCYGRMTRIGYRVVRYCPWFFKLFYPVLYRAITGYRSISNKR